MAKPTTYPVIPSLHIQTQLYTQRRSDADAPTNYRFTIEDLYNFLDSTYNLGSSLYTGSGSLQPGTTVVDMAGKAVQFSGGSASLEVNDTLNTFDLQAIGGTGSIDANILTIRGVNQPRTPTLESLPTGSYLPIVDETGALAGTGSSGWVNLDSLNPFLGTLTEDALVFGDASGNIDQSANLTWDDQKIHIINPSAADAITAVFASTDAGLDEMILQLKSQSTNTDAVQISAAGDILNLKGSGLTVNGAINIPPSVPSAGAGSYVWVVDETGALGGTGGWIDVNEIGPFDGLLQNDAILFGSVTGTVEQDPNFTWDGKTMGVVSGDGVEPIVGLFENTDAGLDQVILEIKSNSTSPVSPVQIKVSGQDFEIQADLLTCGNYVWDVQQDLSGRDGEVMTWDQTAGRLKLAPIPASTDTNLANTNLALTGNRSHTGGGADYDLSLGTSGDPIGDLDLYATRVQLISASGNSNFSVGSSFGFDFYSSDHGVYVDVFSGIVITSASAPIDSSPSHLLAWDSADQGVKRIAFSGLIDTNMAANDLTLTADRSHTGAGFDYIFTGVADFGMNVDGLAELVHTGSNSQLKVSSGGALISSSTNLISLSAASTGATGYVRINGAGSAGGFMVTTGSLDVDNTGDYILMWKSADEFVKRMTPAQFVADYVTDTDTNLFSTDALTMTANRTHDGDGFELKFNGMGKFEAWGDSTGQALIGHALTVSILQASSTGVYIGSVSQPISLSASAATADGYISINGAGSGGGLKITTTTLDVDNGADYMVMWDSTDQFAKRMTPAAFISAYASGGTQSLFETIRPINTDSGFTWGTADVVADSTTDILQIVAGENIDIGSDATADAIRITASIVVKDEQSSPTTVSTARTLEFGKGFDVVDETNKAGINIDTNYDSTTSGGSVTANFNSVPWGTYKIDTASAITSLTISNTVTGGVYALHITGGAKNVAFPTGFKDASGTEIGTVTSMADAIVTFYSDGTNFYSDYPA